MQLGFFDHTERLARLEKLGYPLPQLERTIDRDMFRPVVSGIYADRSNGGRPPFDPMLIFKVLVLQQFYNLSDDQTEFQIRDRLSFCRFLGLTPEGRVPDAKTIWVYRERLKHHGLMEPLFDTLMQQINYGYKNHVSIDRKYKRVRSYGVSSAAVHDSQVFEELLHESNSSKDVWADSAYRSEAIEVMLKEAGYRSHVHRKGNRHRMLNSREQEANRKRSQVRARVEHVFAWLMQQGSKWSKTSHKNNIPCE